jgi:long-chain acyl-CoA synthetase
VKYPYENLTTYTLPNLLKRSVELYAKNDAFGMVGDEAYTYAEFNHKIQSTIELLTLNGITKGDKVLLLSQNIPHWGVAYFAVTSIGAIVVPVLPDFHPSDIHHIVRHSEAKAIFVSQKHLSTIEEADRSDVNFVIELENLRIIEELTKKDYLTKIKESLTKLSTISTKVDEPKEDDVASLLYTSGTTGHSKGVMLSHKNLVTNAMSGYSNVTIYPQDVYLSILPLAHTFESTVGFLIPILHGASVYYVDKTPTPTVLLKSFAIVKPTMMISVPLIIEKIYKTKIQPKFNDSFVIRKLYKLSFFRKRLNRLAGKKLIETFGGRMRFFGIGGAGLSPFVEEFLIEANFPFVIGYGLTETAPLLSASVLGQKIRFKSTGIPMPGVELKIKNRDPITGEGEIIAKSPSVMVGYYKDEAQTAEVMEDGWFLTGDLGYIDEDGFLYISGRSKNVIIGSGGENIYPEQIEARINKFEEVLDALMIEQNGKLIAKVHLNYELLDKRFQAEKRPEVEVKKEIDDLLEQMRVDVNANISSYSRMVKFVEQIEPFVKTPTKKIKRYLYTE